MAIYHRDSGISWNQYLQAQAFVDDITDGIRRSERYIGSEIEEQTWSMVASNEALGDRMAAGFDRLSYGLDEIASGIAGLRSDFSWAISSLMHKLEVQDLLLRDIYEELRIPDFQKERRYYVEQGYKHYSNGLYTEALENLLKAELLEKTDAFVLYSLGQLYLYQQDLLELEKAQDYFTRAGKYYAAEKKFNKAGTSYFHAGVAAYLRREDATAVKLSEKACEFYPELLEAFYNHAKFLAAQGDASGLQSLELTIHKDRNYVLKALADLDFSKISSQVHELLERLRQEAKDEATKTIAGFEKELDGYIFIDKSSEKIVYELLSKAKTLISRDRYFDYMDCLPVIWTARKQLRDYLFTFEVKEWCMLTAHNVTYSPDGTLLAILASGYNNVLLWEVSTNKILRTFTGHSSNINSVAFSPDGILLSSGSVDKTIKLWEVASGKELATLTGHSNSVLNVAFSPDGILLASGSSDKTIKLWEAASRKELRALTGHSDYIFSVAFSPDGILLASGASDKTIKLWEVASGKELRTLAGNSDLILSIAFSPDGILLASGASDETIKLWEVASGKELRTLAGHSDYIFSVAFSPDGKLLASGSSDETIKLWEVASSKESATLAGHSNSVLSVPFSPDGILLASGASDETIKLWEAASSKELCVLAGHSNSVLSVAFSPDGGILLASGPSDAVKLWSLKSKVMFKRQWEQLQAFVKKIAEASRRAEDEERKRQAEAQQRLEEQGRNEEEKRLRQQAQWQAEARCVVCGEKLTLLEKLGGHMQCKKHR